MTAMAMAALAPEERVEVEDGDEDDELEVGSAVGLEWAEESEGDDAESALLVVGPLPDTAATATVVERAYLDGEPPVLVMMKPSLLTKFSAFVGSSSIRLQYIG